MTPTPRSTNRPRSIRHAAAARARAPDSRATPRAGTVAPRLVRSVDVTLVWLDDTPLATDATWLVELGSRTVRAHFSAVARADEIAAPLLGAAERVAKDATIRARLTLHAPLALDGPASATLVVVDAATHRAVAAGTLDA